jgi:L-ascorbate metabolism protein UlaG (beta-lactamase superfamily)/putative hemolysin
MQKIVNLILVLMMLSACTSNLAQKATEVAATENPPSKLPNPASVYCEQQGNKLEIHTANDGSQSGLCVFPDGQTCEEWAYFRGECTPTEPTGSTPSYSAQATKDASINPTEDNNVDEDATAVAAEESSALKRDNDAGVKVTFIGNAGFMITTRHKKILIDALFQGWEHEYLLPEDIQNSLALAQPPFDNVDLILVSHSHRDHFSHNLVRQHLENDPNTVFASQSKISSLFSSLPNQVLSLDPAPGEPVQMDIDGIQVESIALSHGTGQPSNTGFVITVDGIKVFFTGDIDLSQINYEEFRAYGLPEENIDLAFIQHFYLTEDAADQQFVKEGIRAKYILPIHYFYTNPPMNRKVVLNNYPDAIFFDKELSSWVMPQ